MFTQKSSILKTAVYAVIAAIIVHVGVLTIPTADAAPFISIGSGVKTQGALGSDLVKMIGMLALVNTFMHVMLLIILQMLGYLLQADFFNDPVMMGSLNSIWQLSRNIMNIIFALMLIGVSFLVIITGKTDKVKDKIVNFVVAVILVNFSWFFPRVVLDIANVLTAAVYTIPNAVGSASCFTIDEKTRGPVECRVITDVLIFPSAAESAGGFCGGPDSASCSCLDNIECHKSDTFSSALTTMTSAHAMLNGLAVSFARMTTLAQIPTTIVELKGGAASLSAGEAVRVSFQVAVSIILAFVVQLALVLPLLGLAVGLFIRIIILWVTTAFMPFAFLGYVINGKLGTNVFEFETDIWKEFVNAAFLPTLVALPLVIGFIMLSAVAQIPAPAGMFSMTIGVPILAGVSTWWQILWVMAAVGIIWVGAFKALNRSKIVGGITEKIKGFGETVFRGLAQAPLLVPLPLPGGNKTNANLGTLIHGPKILSDSVRLAASGTSGKTFGEILGQSMGRAGGGGVGGVDPLQTSEFLRQQKQNAQDIVNAIKALNGGGLAGAERDAKFEEIRQKLGPTAQGLKNFETVNLLKEMLKVKNPNQELSTIQAEIQNLQP